MNPWCSERALYARQNAPEDVYNHREAETPGLAAPFSVRKAQAGGKTLIRRTLMQRNRELADFEVDPATGEARVIDASEAGEELLVSTEPTQQSRDRALTGFLKTRAISRMREDRENILAAVDAKSPVDLVLWGHGLSLSDQYWYRAPGSAERWEDVNFFDNEWDPGFGAAVLAGDYDRLASCSPDVPDTTTCGHAVKTWERSDEGILLIKVSERYEGAELMGIKLASDLCAALFDEGCYVPVSAVERYGRPCSASPLMLASDEELADGRRLSAMAGIQGERIEGRVTAELCDARIRAYADIGIADASAHVARMACCSCLSLLADFHEGNFGAIHKVDSNVWRPAPIFDYDGSFGFPFSRPLATYCSNPFLAELLCAHQFSYLSSSWDWSWYDPRALDGFEDRIVEAYAAYRSLPPNFTEIVARLFRIQRNYVDEVASAG